MNRYLWIGTFEPTRNMIGPFGPDTPPVVISTTGGPVTVSNVGSLGNSTRGTFENLGSNNSEIFVAVELTGSETERATSAAALFALLAPKSSITIVLNPPATP